MLRGERVVLRARERDDLKKAYEMSTRNVELEMLGGFAWEPAPFATWEKYFEKDLEERFKSEFAIEVDGRMIGGVGLHPHSMGRRSNVGELGIQIWERENVGKGYGRDALTVFLDWAFFVQNFRKICLDTLAANERAIRCYTAVGFREEGRLREHEWYNGRYDDLVLMGITQREWIERRSRNAMRFAKREETLA